MTITTSDRHSRVISWSICFTGKWWTAWRDSKPFVPYRFKTRKESIRFIEALGKDLDLKTFYTW